jgi:hypothetical protein
VPGDRWDVPVSEMDGLSSSMLPIPEEDYVQPENKLRMFNFASLVQSQTKKWLKKQNVKDWQVEYFGSKADGQRRLGESDMVRVYAEQWGCLMPGYPHAGSGWWRARPLQVADAGSILIGDPKEMFIYYRDQELASLTAGDVEKMNLKQLIMTAEYQRESIYKHHRLDKGVQQLELYGVLSA